MNRIIVECGAIRNRADFHAALARALNFPDWYGGNLDALHDLLTAVADDTAVQLHDWSAAESAMGPYCARVAKVLAISALENPNLTIEFC